MADPAAATPSAAQVVETPSTGLTSAQVAERQARGLTDAGGERTSRSVAEILRANILTRFTLQPWPGFGVFCLYAAAALTAGIVLISRRDA
jgi:hypothetical protein